jgi:tight adherence protein C
MSGVLVAIIAVVIALAAVGLIYGIATFFNPTRTARDRLREMQDQQQEDILGLTGVDQPTGGMNRMAGTLGKLAQPQDEVEVNRLRQMLMQAGFRSRHALEIFNGVRVSGALCLPLLFIPLAGRMSFSTMSLVVVILAAAGYFGPQIYVSNTITKRQKALLSAFPDCLDLLVSSVEAGLGLDAAFRRVAAEMEAAAPDLAREFQMVNHEISAGISRVDALKHLETRTGLDEVRSLVNMLTQAERFGTSIAKSLRVHARVTRQKRMSRAEEEAAKVSPKLTVVMILFLLPVLMMVLMGPAIINVIRTLEG